MTAANDPAGGAAAAGDPAATSELRRAAARRAPCAALALRVRPALRAAFAGVLLAGGATVSAAVIHSLDVDREHGRYELVANTHLAAPAEAIFDVLVDYEDGAFGRISSVYKESDYLEPAEDGTPIVYTRMEGCLMFFCRSMERVERLEAEAPRFIRTTALPEESDFKYSRSEWELEPVEGGTEVTYRLVMEPDFWVPPVVGPWLLKKTLMKGGTRAITRIERLALGLPPPQ
ncbi:MAG: SRPBCC family protein [Gammaproteobacteria bacterium]|nr:SRPBCC family protein [Gammaproteobacteria bacterium]